MHSRKLIKGNRRLAAGVIRPDQQAGRLCGKGESLSRERLSQLARIDMSRPINIDLSIVRPPSSAL